MYSISALSIWKLVVYQHNDNDIAGDVLFCFWIVLTSKNFYKLPADAPLQLV